MGLSSIFKRNSEATGGSGQPRGRSTASKEPSGEVQRARTAARQRLIGAVVLLGIGVVGFPLVFETQPRPIPVDIPIEIPRKEGAPPLTMGPSRPVEPSAAARPSHAAPTSAEDVITESAQESGSPAQGRVADAAPKLPPVATKPAAEAKRVDNNNDGARAQALLEGKPATAPASAAAARFVVQVGAFADAGAAQDTRVKVEKLGLKTYTQVASTAAGGRIRVRVGPFASRDEADRALAKARGAGLSAVVITL